MTDLRTAAKQALEALEADCGGRCNAEYNPCWQREVAETLRAALVEDAMQKFTDVSQEIEAALAEPVQEPVATMTVREDMGADFKFSRAHTLQPGQQFYLYATPLAEEHPCNTHPKAPHGFMRNASHTEDRYVCECEAWDPWEAGYQAGMESAMRMEAESAHILGANSDGSQDTGGLIGCVGHDCGECQARRAQAKRIVTYVCPVCAASLERQE